MFFDFIERKGVDILIMLLDSEHDYPWFVFLVYQISQHSTMFLDLPNAVTL